MVPECCQTASGGLLGVSWGAPGPQEGWLQIRLRPLDAFLTIFGRPWGGPGALWGALGAALGALGSPFDAPGGVV